MDAKPGEFFGVTIPPEVATIAKRVARRAGAAIQELREADQGLGPVWSYWEKTTPVMAARPEPPPASGEEAAAGPPVEAIAIEVVRLELRGPGGGSIGSGFADPKNCLSATRLLRAIENEVLLPQLERFGVRARDWVRGDLEARFLTPLSNARYRPEDEEEHRRREAALDYLELLVGVLDRSLYHQTWAQLERFDEKAAALAGRLGAALNHLRPLTPGRVQASYAFCLPHLFETRPPAGFKARIGPV